ncbi:hypothetical protein FB451DRAFT_1225298 [Mycena latifolia]|nr:hypothetical protein FB451DRAFT_1225298 [Mycena latifolia]
MSPSATCYSPPVTVSEPSAPPRQPQFPPNSLGDVFRAWLIYHCFDSQVEDVQSHICLLIERTEHANAPFVSVNRLLSFCAEYFVSEYLALVEKYYARIDADLEQLTGTATYGSVASSLVQEAFFYIDKAKKVKYGSGKVSEHESSSDSSGTDDEAGGSKPVGRGGQRGRGGRGRVGGRGGRRTRRQGPRGRSQEQEEGRPFREAPQSFISIPSFPNTPPQALKHISSHIGQHPSIQNLGTPMYDPFEPEDNMDADTGRLVVHGTRKIYLLGYLWRGVDPPWHPNTCARGPAFYTTTSPQFAYLHTLLVQPRIFDVNEDPVVLLIFRVCPLALHGSLQSESQSFSYEWFTEKDEEDLIRRGSECMNEPRVIWRFPAKDQSDFVIAPHLALDGESSVYIPRFPFLPVGTPTPVQVAAATKAAWAYLNGCINQIMVEMRVEPEE